MKLPPLHPRPIGVALVLLWGAVSSLLAAVADTEVRQAYNVPAGAADTALKIFSEQSGRGVIVGAATIDGVKTNSIKGRFTAQEALEMMLTRTGLVAHLDEATGAFAIAPAKMEGPNAPKAGAARANSTPVARVATEPAQSGEERIELSPFVVNTSRDTGYQATTTLAGTRLNTPLKDLGASISVLTKDFLEDVGATNATEMLVYATGMEAAGPGGNYSGSSDNINNAERVGDSTRVNPQAGTRTRGLASPSFTRGGFLSDVALDSYNTGAVTVIRGPNAILFGVGSPAGVVDTTLNLPDLHRNRNQVSLRYGNNDSLRNSVNLNRVLIDNKLAVRLAALDDREAYNQRPAFEEKKRIFGAIAFEPFRSTALRGNFESGLTRANRPISILPYNSVAEAWYTAGRPSYDWTFYDDPARNPQAAAQTAVPVEALKTMGQLQLFDRIAYVYSSPTSPAPAYGFRATTPSTAGTAADSVKAQVFNPVAHRDRGADEIFLLSTRNVVDLTGTYWVGDKVFPGQQSGAVPAGIKQQGFTDFSAFDFKNRMLDETSRQGDSFHTFNIAFEQRAWGDRVGLELAYDRQRVDRRSKNSFFSSTTDVQVRVDTTVTLPTGQPNPNLGRPYVVYGQSNWSNNYSDRETRRATGYLKYDFKDLGQSWGKWLGRHTFTGLYEETATNTINYSYRLAVTGAAANAISPNVNVFGRRPIALVYIGPSIIGNNNPLRLEPIRIPELAAGPTVPARYFARAGNATDPGAFVDAPSSLVEVVNNGFGQREVIKSQAAALQSYWLRDHLITLVGWRRDEDYFTRQTISFVTNPANSNDPGKVHYGFNDFTFPRTPPPNVANEIMSYSAVLRWPKNLFRLPAGSDLSVFYNQSQNFTPVGGRIDAFGESMPSPQGKTREYGFNASALNDRLSLRVNWFETSVQGQSYSPGSLYGLATGNAVIQTASFWAIEGNINPQLAAQRNADVELLFSRLPANYRSLRNWRVTGTAPNLAVAFDNLNASGDSTDYTAKGLELEVVFNPTRNWRILANVAKQETVQSNSLPFLKKFIALMRPIWDQLRDRPQTNYPLGWKPGDPPPGGYGPYIESNVYVPFATAIATEGSASAEQRKWRSNVVSNYSFGRDSIFGERLKGWSVGGAVRWQDKLGIGYPTTRNPDSSVKIDVAHPYYAPAEINVDAWVGYERKIWSKRINWKVQFNVRNLYGETDPIAIAVQPWGETASTRLAPERRWYVTNTFGF